MTDLTHEEEFLNHLTGAGVLGVRLLRAAFGRPDRTGEATDVKALKAAGYREQTPFDDHLRRDLGEHRWAMYVADPARVVCAALITDGDRAGYDMTALLSRVAIQRAWEDDTRSPAKSIARVLAFRLGKELASRNQRAESISLRTNGGASSSIAVSAGAGPRRGQPPSLRTPPPAAPMPVTPYDDRIRELLGQQRWNQFAADKRRRDVAEQLTTAAAQGHDVDALLTHAITCRDWEDDPRSPSRRVGGVLHHRVETAIASGRFKSTASGDDRLPSGVAQVVANAAAPAGSSQNDPGRAETAAEAASRPRRIQQRPGPQRE